MAPAGYVYACKRSLRHGGLGIEMAGGRRCGPTCVAAGIRIWDWVTPAQTCTVQAGTHCCWHKDVEMVDTSVAQAGTLVALRTRAAPPPASGSGGGGGGDEDDDLAAAIAASLADAGAAAPDGAAPAGERGGGGEDADLELARAIAASMGDNAAWQARRPAARRGRGRRCWTGRALLSTGMRSSACRA